MIESGLAGLRVVHRKAPARRPPHWALFAQAVIDSLTAPAVFHLISRVQRARFDFIFRPRADR